MFFFINTIRKSMWETHAIKRTCVSHMPKKHVLIISILPCKNKLKYQKLRRKKIAKRKWSKEWSLRWGLRWPPPCRGGHKRSDLFIPHERGRWMEGRYPPFPPPHITTPLLTAVGVEERESTIGYSHILRKKT